MTARARLITTLVALVLVAPVAGIRLQDTERLERFHTRRLAAWPEPAAFVDPPAAFRAARAWLTDRAWPTIAATNAYKRFLYFVLGSPPAHKLTIGLDGQVFLNSWNETEPDVLLESLCVRAHGADAGRGLSRSLGELATFSREIATPVDVIVVPTTATLYAERLPPSVSRRLREGCAAVAAGRSALRDVQVPAGVRYLYLYDALRPFLADPAFYPRNNWHASGKSLAVLRDTWLAAAGLPAVVDERIEAVDQPAEMLLMSGVADPQPAYAVRNAHVRFDAARDAAFRAAVGDLFTNPAFPSHVYLNDRPPVDASLLIVSDSFGQLAAEVFAGAFAEVTQVNTNDLPLGNAAELVARARALHRVDRIVLLFQEGGVDRAINYGRVLRRAQ
ncbi:hypothetical protein [Tahibacter soli]|uniref:Uncharacterized protein n=1 Tax=Tahibacter soli TaxID=2983605 RepID=A0A9X4BHZ7_9GAMM|nr:hypothetical protein [Tahibacter soli]MDC8011712.1 hypothetical protein [Tahibacter soli]